MPHSRLTSTAIAGPSNARHQAPLIAAARHERRLLAVACKPVLGPYAADDTPSELTSLHCLGWDAILPDATPLGAMGHGTAYRVNGSVGDEQVGVRPLRPKGVVARQT